MHQINLVLVLSRLLHLRIPRRKRDVIMKMRLAQLLSSHQDHVELKRQLAEALAPPSPLCSPSPARAPLCV